MESPAQAQADNDAVPRIDTKGGAHVAGDVDTGGGDLVGRDKTVSGDEVRGHKVEIGTQVIYYGESQPSPTDDKQDDDAPAPGESPYKGLEFFDRGDAGIFFGRETLTAELVAHLRQHCLLAVVGASGSGKSSVVRAGLVPALQHGKPLVDRILPPEGSTHWPVHVITPTVHPLKALAASLTPDSESVMATITLIDDFARDARSLDIYVSRILGRDQSKAQAASNRLLLVVDQFEELFTLCRDKSQRTAFIDNLLTAAVPDGRTVVIITLRADFYAHCTEFDNLRTAFEHYQRIIGPMQPDELRRAIEVPARLGGWELEPELVELMLKDVGDEPGALPLLSHALLETWQRRRGRKLTFADYQAAGRVQGAIAQTANRVYTALSTEQQQIARNIFLRLTELGEGAQDTRRRVDLDELIATPAEKPDVEAVLKTLADARLVTTFQEEAEVAHEALIREWPTLRNWLAENRQGLRIHRRLTEAAQEWERLGRDPGALYRGARLLQVQEWTKRHQVELNELERTFLDTSQAMIDREEQEREAARQRELEQAQERAETARRNSRRLRWLLGVMAVLLVAAIALALVAYSAQREAATERETAKTERNGAVEARETAEAGKDRAVRAEETAEARRIEAETAREDAERQEQEAQRQAKAATLATSRQLALQAKEKLANDAFLDGALLAVQAGQTAQTVEAFNVLWDAQVYPARLLTNSQDPSMVMSAAWNADGQRVLMWRLKSSIAKAWAEVWEVATGTQLATLSLEGWDSEVASLRIDAAWSPDGQRVLIWNSMAGLLETITVERTAPHPSPVLMWDAATGRQITTLQHEGHAIGAAWSANSQHVLTWSRDGTTIVWAATTGQQLATLRHAGPVKGGALSMEGQRVLTWTDTYAVAIWELTSRRPVVTLPHGGPVGGAAWSPDGQRVLIWSDYSKYNTVGVWTAKGQRLAGLQHNEAVNGATWSADGQRILTWSQDNTAGVWAAMTGKRLATLPHEDDVNGATWSADGQRILTWSKDNMAGVWAATTGQRLATLNNIRGYTGAAWSADGQHVLTVDWQGTIRTWTINMAWLINQVCENIPRNFRQDEWRMYFGDEPHRNICPAYSRYLGNAKKAAANGDIHRVEEIFAQAVAVAKEDDGVTLDLDPQAEAVHYTVPHLAARANAAALACKVDEAAALYQQVRDLAPDFFAGEPQAVAAALANQSECK